MQKLVVLLFSACVSFSAFGLTFFEAQLEYATDTQGKKSFVVTPLGEEKFELSMAFTWLNAYPAIPQGESIDVGSAKKAFLVFPDFFPLCKVEDFSGKLSHIEEGISNLKVVISGQMCEEAITYFSLMGVTFSFYEVYHKESYINALRILIYDAV